MSSTQHADAQNELEALHCEAVSRLSSALGVQGPDVVHARRLGRLLNVGQFSGVARPPRTPLFGGPLVAASASAPVSSLAYSSLEEALPDWYEAHNRRCAACQVALFLGLNATFTCHEGERAIVCGRCSTVNVSEKPSYESKRALRSQKYRASRAKNVSEGTQSSPKKRPAELTQPSQAVPLKAARNLAERQAELKRKQKDAKKAIAAKPVPSTDSTKDAQSTPRESPSPSIDTMPSKSQAPSKEQPTVSSRLSINNKRNMMKQKSALKPDRDALALQEMLQRNRKRQEERSKRAEPKTGLQDFLSSL